MALAPAATTTQVSFGAAAYPCESFLHRFDAAKQTTRNALGSAATTRALWDFHFSKPCSMHNEESCASALFQSGYGDGWWTDTNTYTGEGSTVDEVDVGTIYQCIWDGADDPGGCARTDSLEGANHMRMKTHTPEFLWAPDQAYDFAFKFAGGQTCGPSTYEGSVIMEFPG
jgi:hypothetical protein